MFLNRTRELGYLTALRQAEPALLVGDTRSLDAARRTSAPTCEAMAQRVSSSC